MRTLYISICAALLALVPADPAAAAPQYVSSEPADGAELHQAPEEVRITFSEPLDASSKMKVEDHCGNRLDDGNVQVSANEMSVGIATTPGGHYMVTYGAVGFAGVTGTNAGRFGFTVHAGEKCSGGAHHGDGGGHEGHEGGGGNDGEQGGHSGHGGNGHEAGHRTDGEASDHGDHAAGAQAEGHDAGEHPEHATAMGSEQEGHEEHAAAQRERERSENRLKAIATGESPFPEIAPDSTAVLLALLLCVAFGGLGGFLLRAFSSHSSRK